VVGLMLISLPLAPQMMGDSSDGPDQGVPANKTSVAASKIEFMSAPLTGPGSSSEEVTLLSTVMRSTNPSDLVVSVTLECALWTSVFNTGNDDNTARAAVKIWVEIDGTPIMINPDEPGEDDGKVTFCDRMHRQETADFDDEDARINQYLETRTANGFNWILIGVGQGVHEIVVKGQLETDVIGAGEAQAAIGKRTVVAEPFMFAHNEQL
jgi:hypothetical protein